MYLIVASAPRPGIASQVPRRNQRKPRWPPGGPPDGAGDGFARRQVESLYDASAEFDHRKHWIVGAFPGIDAVERHTRPHEIKMGLWPKEDAGRIGQRRGNVPVEPAHFVKQADLTAVLGVVRVCAVFETAHQKRDATALRRERGRFLH